MTDELYSHRARKRFGQNFLHDPGVIQRILRAISPKQGQSIVEIGPGQGALTESLLEGAGALDVVELDRDLIPILKLRFGLNPEFRIHNADALAFDFSQLGSNEEGDKPLRIVGNLPYNISTPLLFHLLTFSHRIEDMHFMLQKEVVQRMAAGPNEKNYGRLGIMIQYYCRVDYLFDVGPGAFNPPPKVDSAIVRLTPHKELPHPCKSVKTLEHVLRTTFNQRRKTLRNTLKKEISAEEFIELGIEPTLRPESLALDSFVKIADYIFDKKSSSND
ncbi:16S rRNA (adenine(1518)-N(6)/adenine(1519)-N(6))-dimethyltransferase RsmA [Spongorhabdus nitratireducens]